MSKISKKIMALTLAVIMMFATCMTAFATDGSVTFYKASDTSQTSMANRAVKSYTVTENGNNYDIVLTMQGVDYYVVKGYITQLTINGQNYQATTPVTADDCTISFSIAKNQAGDDIPVSFQVAVYSESGTYLGTPHDYIDKAPTDISAVLVVDVPDSED